MALVMRRQLFHLFLNFEGTKYGEEKVCTTRVETHSSQKLAQCLLLVVSIANVAPRSFASKAKEILEYITKHHKEIP